MPVPTEAPLPTDDENVSSSEQTSDIIEESSEIINETIKKINAKDGQDLSKTFDVGTTEKAVLESLPKEVEVTTEVTTEITKTQIKTNSDNIFKTKEKIAESKENEINTITTNVPITWKSDKRFSEKEEAVYTYTATLDTPVEVDENVDSLVATVSVRYLTFETYSLGGYVIKTYDGAPKIEYFDDYPPGYPPELVAKEGTHEITSQNFINFEKAILEIDGLEPTVILNNIDLYSLGMNKEIRETFNIVLKDDSYNNIEHRTGFTNVRIEGEEKGTGVIEFEEPTFIFYDVIISNCVVNFNDAILCDDIGFDNIRFDMLIENNARVTVLQPILDLSSAIVKAAITINDKSSLNIDSQTAGIDNCSTINMNGKWASLTINAANAAAIGSVEENMITGGLYLSAGKVTLNGAYGGIWTNKNYDIFVSGGTLETTATISGSGIFIGEGSAQTSIDFSGGTTKANGAGDGSGIIVKNNGENNSPMKISGNANVEAIGGELGGSGIGDILGGSHSSLEISGDSFLTATGTGTGSGIGATQGSMGEVSIGGNANVTVTGGDSGAGIGGENFVFQSVKSIDNPTIQINSGTNGIDATFENPALDKGIDVIQGLKKGGLDINSNGIGIKSTGQVPLKLRDATISITSEGSGIINTQGETILNNIRMVVDNKTGSSVINENNGKLTVKSSMLTVNGIDEGAVAIGVGTDAESVNPATVAEITIENSDIKAKNSGYAPTVGVAGTSITEGFIKIITSAVNAVNSGSGPAIGTRAGISNIDITVGGLINATGGTNSAGIGSGYKQGHVAVADGSNITIDKGSVTAIGGAGGAGIGGGFEGAVGKITISGAGTHVTATGGRGSSGIGASENSFSGVTVDSTQVEIIDATVIAKGFGDGAGIGGGQYNGINGLVKIQNADITAQGGDGGAGIGGGFASEGGSIIIDGGIIDAKGGSSAAGIGGGFTGTAVLIDIKGAEIKAVGGSLGGAGIGGGKDANGADELIINSGNVEAIGGGEAQSIGAGFGGDKSHGKLTTGVNGSAVLKLDKSTTLVAPSSQILLYSENNIFVHGNIIYNNNFIVDYGKTLTINPASKLTVTNGAIFGYGTLLGTGEVEASRGYYTGVTPSDIGDIDDVVYNSFPQTPRITKNETRLIYGKDFTIEYSDFYSTYKDNINAGTASFIYKNSTLGWEVVKTFNILKADQIPVPNNFNLSYTVISGLDRIVEIPAQYKSNQHEVFEYKFEGGTWSTTVRTKTVQAGDTVIAHIRKAESPNYKVSAVSTVTEIVPSSTVANITALPAEGSTLTQNTEITLETSTPGATIYYSIGEENPVVGETEQSKKYTGPFMIDKSCTVKALAAKEGYNNSGIKRFYFTINKASNPNAPLPFELEITQANDYSSTVKIPDPQDGNNYEYSFDELSWSTAVEDQTITANSGTSVTGYRREVATDSMNAGSISSNTKVMPTYTVEPVTSNVIESEILVQDTEITLTSATLSDKNPLTIYYTTDGTEPQIDRLNLYSGPFTITDSTTVRAMAIKEGMNNSAIVDFTYVLERPLPTDPILPFEFTLEPISDYRQKVTIPTPDDAVVYEYRFEGKEWSIEAADKSVECDVGDVVTGERRTAKTSINQAGLPHTETITVGLVQTQPVTSSVDPTIAHDKNISVELKTLTTGDAINPITNIFYTVNGGWPELEIGGETKKYTGEILVTTDTTIKAVAIKNGMAASEYSTFEFKINKPKNPTPPLPFELEYTLYNEDKYKVTIPELTDGVKYEYRFANSLKWTHVNTYIAEPGTFVQAYKRRAETVTLAPSDEVMASVRLPGMQVKPVIATPASGTYNGSINVYLSTPTQTASIYYTTDGTTPVGNEAGSSKLFVNNIVVADNCQIRAIAIEGSMQVSVESVFDYEIVKLIPPQVEGFELVVDYLTDYSYTVTIPKTPALRPEFAYEYKFNEADPWGDANSKTALVGETITAYRRTKATAVYLPSDAKTDSVTLPMVKVKPITTNQDASQIFVKDTIIALGTETVTSDEKNANIYYTTNGNTPTIESVMYTVPFTITKDTTVKAFATKEGMIDSEIASFEFKVKKPKETVAPAAFELQFAEKGDYEKVATIPLPEGEIVYEFSFNGSDWGPNNTKDVQVGESITGHIRKKETATHLASDATTHTVNPVPMNNVKAVTANPAEGIFDKNISISLSTATSAQLGKPVEIYYTTNGTNPDVNIGADGNATIKYNGPIAITKDTTIIAIATKAGMSNSVPETMAYDINKPVPVAPAAFTLMQSKKTDYTSNIIIPVPADTDNNYEYSFDGTNWSDTVNTKVVGVKTSVSGYIRYKETAVAGASLATSDTIESVSINNVEIVTASPDANQVFNKNIQVVLSTLTVDSDNNEVNIYYTLDGSEPNENLSIEGNTTKIYAEPILVNTTRTIKTFATKKDMNDSNVQSFLYTIEKVDPEPPEAFTLQQAEKSDYEKTITIPVPAPTDMQWEYEYSFDGVNWSDSIRSKDITVKSAITGYIRVKESDGTKASAPTSDTINSVPLNDVKKVTATPDFTVPLNKDTQVSLLTQTAESGGNEVTIYYTTDGTQPNKELSAEGNTTKVYTAPFTITKSTTIKAFAVKKDMNNTAISEFGFVVDKNAAEAPPAFEFVVKEKSDYEKTITIPVPSDTSKIYEYSFDGIKYDDNRTITVDVGTKVDGYVRTQETSSLAPSLPAKTSLSPVPLNQVKDIVTNTAAGEINKVTDIELTTPTRSASIYYTVDGSVPTTSSVKYTAPINVTADITIKAIAVKSNMITSDEFTVTYTMNKAVQTAPPAFEFNMVETSDFIKTVTIPVPSATSEGEVYEYSFDGITYGTLDYNRSKIVNLPGSVTGYVRKAETDDKRASEPAVTKLDPVPLNIVKNVVVTPENHELTQDTFVYLNTPTAAATIYYTTDGSAPIVSPEDEYSGKFEITKTSTVKAIAVKENMQNSVIESVDFTMTKLPQPPTSDFNLIITRQDEISYTAEIPDQSGAEYKFGDGEWGSTISDRIITENAGNTVTGYRRRAQTATHAASPAVSDSVTLDKVSVKTVTTSPQAGDYTQDTVITLASETVDATIYYTTNGDEPTTDSNEYTAPFTITKNSTVKAIAVKEYMSNSETGVFDYTITKLDQEKPADFVISYTATGDTSYLVEIPEDDSCEYSFDGINYSKSPNTVAVAGHKIIAYMRKCETPTINPSEATTAQATLPMFTVKPVTASPEGGDFTGSTTVNLKSETQATTIYYTVDGQQPTSSSTAYTQPIILNESTELKAVAIKADMKDSDVATFSFTKLVSPYVPPSVPGDEIEQPKDKDIVPAIKDDNIDKIETGNDQKVNLIATEKLIEEIKLSQDETVVIEVAVPDLVITGKNIQGLMIEKEVFELIKELQKNLLVNITDFNGEFIFSWGFSGKTVEKPEDIYVGLSFEKIQDRVLVSFVHKGVLPGPATIGLNTDGIYQDEKSLYLYQENGAKDKLEFISKGHIVEDGIVEFSIDLCSVYVLIDKELKLPEADKVIAADKKPAEEETNMMFGYIVGGVAVIVVLVLFIVKKKKHEEQDFYNWDTK